MYIHTCIQIYSDMYFFIHLCTFVKIHTYLHTCRYVCIFVHMYIYIYVYVYAYILCIYTYICLHDISPSCHALWHTATYCTLQHTKSRCNILQHTATHCHTLQHTATHYNTLQHYIPAIKLWNRRRIDGTGWRRPMR